MMTDICAFEFELGSVVRDVVTGFEGVVDGRTEWLSRCIRYSVASQSLHDGKPIETQWIDEGQLVAIAPVLPDLAKAPAVQAAGRPGGPTPRPVRAADPTERR